MERIKYYTIGLIVCTILLILFHFYGLIDVIVFIAFALSSIFLVFSQEELPKTKSSLAIPEIHYYYKSRMNTYGYSMASMLIVISVLFSILSVFLNLRLGIASLICWLIANVATRLIAKYTSESVDIDAIEDYINSSIKNVNNEERYKIQLLTRYLHSLNVKQENIEIHEDSILDYIEDIQMQPQLATQIIDEYLAYTSSTSTRITSSEIIASNDNKRERI